LHANCNRYKITTTLPAAFSAMLRDAAYANPCGIMVNSYGLTPH